MGLPAITKGPVIFEPAPPVIAAKRIPLSFQGGIRISGSYDADKRPLAFATAVEQLKSLSLEF